MVGLAQLPSQQIQRSQRLPLSHTAPLQLSKKLIPKHHPNLGRHASQSVNNSSTPLSATSPSHPNSDICWVACSSAAKIPQLAAWGNFPAHSAGRKKARRTKCAASLFACPRTRWEVTPCGQLRGLCCVRTSNPTYISEFGCEGRFVFWCPEMGARLWNERLT